MAPREPRPEIVGPDAGPEAPFPLRMKGEVVSGFGRGSKELGIPTANIPVEGVPWIDSIDSGVYYGWTGIQLPAGHPDLSSDLSPVLESSAMPTSAYDQNYRLFPMVMSIGYNPFYKNTVRSAEVHVMHSFKQDFYGSNMAISILGYIRQELDYVSVELLIEDIQFDIKVAKNSLMREHWRAKAADGYLWGEQI